MRILVCVTFQDFAVDIRRVQKSNPLKFAKPSAIPHQPEHSFCDFSWLSDKTNSWWPQVSKPIVRRARCLRSTMLCNVHAVRSYYLIACMQSLHDTWKLWFHPPGRSENVGATAPTFCDSVSLTFRKASCGSVWIGLHNVFAILAARRVWEFTQRRIVTVQPYYLNGLLPKLSINLKTLAS